MGCNCDNTLLGALSLPPIKKGARFQFGYNTGYGTGPFESADIAQMTNAAGITQDAVSYTLSGTLSYYITVEGKAGQDYGSASDLRDAIYKAIVSGGFSIDPASINFNFDPAPGAQTGPQTVYTGPSASGGGSINLPGVNFFDEIASSLNVTRNTAQLVVFGGIAILAITLLKK